MFRSSCCKILILWLQLKMKRALLAASSLPASEKWNLYVPSQQEKTRPLSCWPYTVRQHVPHPANISPSCFERKDTWGTSLRSDMQDEACARIKRKRKCEQICLSSTSSLMKQTWIEIIYKSFSFGFFFFFFAVAALRPCVVCLNPLIFNTRKAAEAESRMSKSGLT